MTILAALYAAAILALLLYGGNLLWLSLHYASGDGAPRPPLASDMAPDYDGRRPEVTVQLPVYNEANVIERLIDACAQLDYPLDRLEIQVLDDSTDETVELAAERVEHWRARGRDIVHIRRNDRDGYKSGALKNGFRLARGDFLAVFDADFLPERDFLKQTLPSFDAAGVGAVQGRWGHLNADTSLLTRLQAFGLDMHFAIEQYVRSRAGWFITFNGTAGVWRRECIEDAGGWQTDTLTEDMDLSYRAQLRGWRIHYRPEVEAPAELPASMNALRAQQFRWAKGGAETSRKLLGRLWQSGHSPSAKIQGTMHLSSHSVFVFIALAAILHAPLLVAESMGGGPGPVYFLVMSLGLIGFTGFALAHVLAQRALYPDWIRRIRLLPVFMAGSMGLSLDMSRAHLQGLRGRVTSFVRTPKMNAQKESTARSVSAGPSGSPRGSYLDTRLPAIAWLETGFALYCLAGLVALIFAGQWAALPFQAAFAGGFGLVAAASLGQRS